MSAPPATDVATGRDEPTENQRLVAADDGTALATTVVLPHGAGPFPTVLLRTPYGRHAHRAELRSWAARGFAALAQDVRGRHDSAGRWEPYQHEARDGAASARWIRRQPWSDGRLVAAGGSYAAYCALSCALDEGDAERRPDAVIAAVPALGLVETARELTGPERLLDRVGWWAAHGDRPDSDTTALRAALDEDPGLLEHLPPLDLPRRLGRALPSWPAVWEERTRGALLDQAARARVPLLAVGGSHDTFVSDTVRLWEAWGGPSARLLVGPWGHGLTAEAGPDAHPAHRLNLGGTYASWASAALAGTLADGRAGTVALGGSPHWLPAPDMSHTSHTSDAADHQRYPFSGTSRLQLLSGDDFTADPWRPVRSDSLHVPRESPADRCLLATGPLPRPVDLLGHASVRLRGRASTPSADWVARLVALTPGGRAQPLATGVLRQRVPRGEEREFQVPLGWIARRLPAGSRLRLEIAGHHFPAHARNPHTGQDPVSATTLLPSKRHVRTCGSELILPLRSGRAFVESVNPVQEIHR